MLATRDPHVCKLCSARILCHKYPVILRRYSVIPKTMKSRYMLRQGTQNLINYGKSYHYGRIREFHKLQQSQLQYSGPEHPQTNR